MKIFIDGQLIGTEINRSPLEFNGIFDHAYIGHYVHREGNTQKQYTGKLGDFKIYNYPLHEINTCPPVTSLSNVQNLPRARYVWIGKE